jgi:hypothetical protein
MRAAAGRAPCQEFRLAASYTEEDHSPRTRPHGRGRAGREDENELAVAEDP